MPGQLQKLLVVLILALRQMRHVDLPAAFKHQGMRAVTLECQRLRRRIELQLRVTESATQLLQAGAAACGPQSAALDCGHKGLHARICKGDPIQDHIGVQYQQRNRRRFAQNRQGLADYARCPGGAGRCLHDAPLLAPACGLVRTGEEQNAGIPACAVWPAFPPPAATQRGAALVFMASAARLSGDTGSGPRAPMSPESSPPSSIESLP